MAEEVPTDAPATNETVAAQAHDIKRGDSVLQKAGTTIQRAGTNLTFQRAGTLPTDNRDLRHAATMPTMFDVEAHRPWCGGLWKTQQLFGFILGVFLCVFFCSLHPMKTYPSANDMLGITALCACFWVFEVIPVYITSLFPLILMPFMKITSSEIAAQAYWNWISLLVVGTFLVDIALEEAHIPRRLALKLLLKIGVVHPAALLAVFMILTWVLAMFCNSIAVTLLITPFAIGLMNAAEEQAWSTSGASEAAEEGTQEAAARTAAGEIQRFTDALLLGIAYSATSGGLATINGAITNYFLAGEDLVKERLGWARWFEFAWPISCLSLVLCYCVLYLRYVRGLKFSGLEHDFLLSEYEELLKEVGPFSRDEVLVSAIQILQTTLLILRPYTISPAVVSPYGANLVNDSTIACIPAVLLFFLPSSVRPGQALLTWPAVHEKFDFGLLLLIGGGLAINAGFTESGLNIALGDAFASLIPHVSPFILDFVIIICVALCSQVFSSIGTAAAMLPALGSAAVEAVVNPMSLLLPATVATSFAFLLPTATPPNVVVLAKSQELPRPLRIRDFCSNGLPITLFACVGGAILTQVMGTAVFNSQEPFPQWACEASRATCMFVDVPGVVQGYKVDTQACIVDLGAAAGTLCRLWNGTVLNTTMYAWR